MDDRARPSRDEGFGDRLMVCRPLLMGESIHHFIAALSRRAVAGEEAREGARAPPRLRLSPFNPREAKMRGG